MAETREYSIKIDGIEQSVKGVDSLGDSVKNTTKTFDDYVKVVEKAQRYADAWAKLEETEYRKSIKNQYELKQAREIVAKGAGSTYAEQQRYLTALGKVIKNTKGDVSGLIDEYNKLNDSLKKVDAQMGNHQRNVGNYKSSLEGINKPFSGLINVAKSTTSALQLYNGVMAVFTDENEDASESMKKLMSTMSIIQSLNQLNITLKEGSVMSNLFAKALGNGTMASKALRGALLAIPLMLVITAVTELILHWEELVGWFEKTFPALKNLSTWFDKVKGAVSGLGNAVWETIKSFGSLGDIIKAIFSGEWEKAAQIAQENFNKIAQGFKTGYADKIVSIEEEKTAKLAEEQNKQTKHQLEMLKAQKGNQAKYSKEGIALQKKDFEERRKMAKNNKDKLNKIAVEEANFYREMQESKSKSAQKSAKSAADAAKKAAEELKKAEEKAREYHLKTEDKLLKTTLENQLKNQELMIKAANDEVEKFKNGPEDKLLEALKKLEAEEQKLLDIQRTQKGYDHFIDYRENISGATSELGAFKEGMESLLGLMKGLQSAKNEVNPLLEENWNAELERIKELYGEDSEEFKKAQKDKEEAIKNIGIISAEEFESEAKQVKLFSQLSKDEYKYLYGIYIEYVNDFLEQKKNKSVETEKEIAQKTIGINKKTIEDITASLSKFTTDLPQKVNTSIWDKLFNKDKAKKAANDYRTAWWNAMTAIANKIPTLTLAWDEYLAKVKLIYGEDSKEYIEACNNKEEALKKLIELQNQAQKNVNEPQSGDTSKKNGNQFMDFDQNVVGNVNWDDIGKTIEDAYDAFVDPIVGGLSDTIGMMLDFAIEEAEEALEEAEEIHDKAVEKVDKSKSRLSEINSEMANASATRLEQLKSQQADEMTLLAQREAEEKRAEREKERREQELERKKKQQRKMELKVQMVEALASGALAAINGFATKPFIPVGLAMGALATTLAAAQIGILSKQLSKLADGGVLGGKSHAQGGVKIPSLGVEVEKGEAVINKRSTAKYLPLLDAINAEGNGGKHTLLSSKQNAIKRFADGGVLNYQKISDNFEYENGTRAIERAIGTINITPQVAVTDICRGINNLTTVRQMAGSNNMLK